MRIIEETLAPGAVVTEIARRHGIATSLVFTWRRTPRDALPEDEHLTADQFTPLALASQSSNAA
jgi:transposase